MMLQVAARRSKSARCLPIRLILLVLLFVLSWWGVCRSVENEECLECHGTREVTEMSKEDKREMVVPTPGRKEVWKGKLTLYVNYTGFRSSVHKGLKCVQCHTEVRGLPHPQRMGMVNCARCHGKVVSHYKASKHARVSQRLCFECHNPHTTVSFKKLSKEERMKICLQCHKEEGHSWLPQRQLHFKYLECTVCHAPKAEKGLFFHLTAETADGKRVTLSYQQLKDFTRGYEGDVARAVDRNANGLVEVHEINRFIAKLRAGRVRSPRLEEEVLVLRPYHNYTDEVKDVKDCAMCHVSGAPFYSQVMLRIPDETVGWRTVKMDKAIIGKMPAIPSKDYYSTTVHGKSGVECIDCHADLTILREGEGFKVKELGTPVCGYCHEGVMREYKDSLHAKVSEKICFGCHDPHSSIPFKELDVEQRKAICTKCHDPERAHEWLPQRELHFKYLECTNCHAPQAERGLVFYLQRIDEAGREKRLEYREVAELLGKNDPDLVKLMDVNDNGFLEDREVLSFLRLIRDRSRRYKIELGVRVLVLKPSHNYTNRATKAKDCSLCHSSRAQFYSKLIMEIPERVGGVRTLPLEKSILVGIHDIPITSDFYLLGESRISKRDIADLMYVVRKIGYKWMDILGVLFLLGGFGFVAIHGVIRILTMGMRKQGRRRNS